MKVTFLSGLPGSGKTFKCLEEIKAQLKASPDGLPLIFIVPKQFTYQLERQILSDPEVKGYTRLLIFSFERFADYIISEFSNTKYNILSEEGKVMVLRSILSRIEPLLKVYGKSIKHNGFSNQLSQVLQELQSFGISVGKLKEGAQNIQLPLILRNKLEDLALILENYQNWLEKNGLLDFSRLLDVAIDAVSKGIDLKIDALWLDGFATLSELQIEFLAKILPHCNRATIAFCVDADDHQNNGLFARGFVINKFLSKCRNKIETEKECEVFTQCLEPVETRFKEQPALEYIQKHWGDFSVDGYNGDYPLDESKWWNEGGVKIISCSNPLAEVMSAARTIRQYVRKGGRYRDIAVLMRNLDNYHDLIRRIFYNFDIPFFLDRRESISHHPLAELIRYALRLVLFGWQQDDLFGALKLGFSPVSDSEIDWLENQAIANGWSGKVWQMPLSIAGDERISQKLEDIRKRVIQPLINFEKNLIASQDVASPKPVGKQVANAIRELFLDWNVEEQLMRWRDELISSYFRSYVPPSIHQTALEEVINLFENFELAFGKEQKDLSEWVQIIETGLSGLTAGAIPPSLDQVLIGAIDRSRNPELKLLIAIGLNEEVFPETPKFSPLLNEVEREILANKNIYNGFSLQILFALEWYYGYIACTRASKYLYLTYPTADWSGKTLNPSPFITHIQKLFPSLKIESFIGVTNYNMSEHPSELAGFLANKKYIPILTKLKPLEPMISRASKLCGEEDAEMIPQSALKILIGNVLNISVSGLADYAACPFKYFVKYILKAEERITYEVDPRHIGKLQHLILEEFHKSLIRENKKWRDLTPDNAVERIDSIANKLINDYNNELFFSHPSNLFQAKIIVERMKQFIKVNIEWLNESYGFDPSFVELSFGLEDSALPPLEIKIDDSHKMLVSGRIDRVDLYLEGENGEYPCVVIDYKSSLKKIDDALLLNGIELQLPIYLLLLVRTNNIRGTNYNVKPVGAFYVNLRGHYEPAKNVSEFVENNYKSRREAFQYHGRFNVDYLKYLDLRPDGEKSGQFKYSLKKDGQLTARSKEGMNGIFFKSLIDATEVSLKKYGASIFEGNFKVDPWRKTNWKKACENCLYKAICRIDILNHKWRVIR